MTTSEEITTNNPSPSTTASKEFIENESKCEADPSRSESTNGNSTVEAVETEENKQEKDEWQDLLGSGSLMKKILREGEPNTRPQRLQRCIINYKLTLENDELVEEVENFELQLGDCEVVQGLDVALGLMNVNEKCLLKIQPRLAYGKSGLQPKIPPDSNVVFEVELVSVGAEEEPETLSIAQRKIQGNKKRERGNWWYCRGENTLAIQCYRRALDYLDEVEGGITDPTVDKPDDKDLQSLLEDRISVCNNMAAAQIKLEHYDAALNSLQTVLRCQPNNVKALFRKAKIYRAKNDLNAAIKCLKKADESSPNNNDIQKEINIITKLIQKQKVTERDLARRMFGDKTSLNNSNQKIDQTKQKRSILMMSATIAASCAVALVGVAAYRLKYT